MSCKRLFIQLSFLFLVTISISAFLFQYIFNYKTFRGLAVEALSDKTEVLFVGSCHFAYGIRPDLQKRNVMNLATNNLDYLEARKILKANLEKVPNIRLVVLEYDLGILLTDPTPHRSIHEMKEFNLIKELNTGEKIAHFDHNLRELINPISEFRLNPETLWNIYQHRNGTIERDNLLPGHIPSQVVMSDETSNHYESIFKSHTNKIGIQYAKKNKEELFSMIDELSEKGVQVRLLRMPRHISFRGWFPKEWELTTDSVFKEVKVKYPTTASEFWNYYESKEFTVSDFRNPDQLNSIGAKKMASFLEKKLEAVLSNEPSKKLVISKATGLKHFIE